MYAFLKFNAILPVFNRKCPEPLATQSILEIPGTIFFKIAQRRAFDICKDLQKLKKLIEGIDVQQRVLKSERVAVNWFVVTGLLGGCRHRLIY